jgi:hypothetical protein
LGVLIISFNISNKEMKFERGKDPKKSLDIGIKDEKGYNITHITDENFLLPGIDPEDIYMITHIGSRNVVGFCSGRKVMRILLSLKKGGYLDYQYKWIWSYPGSANGGGNLSFYYSSGGGFWIDANNTKGYSFSRMGEGSIMEL